MPGEGPGERPDVVEAHGDGDLEDGTVRLGQQGHGTKHPGPQQVASPRQAKVGAGRYGAAFVPKPRPRASRR